MPPSTLPAPPRLALERLRLDEVVFREESTQRGTLISGEFTGVKASGSEIAACHVTAAAFTGAELRRLRLTDCVVEASDLSGADLEGAVLARCVFRDSKLSGLVLARARLRDVVFSDCRFDGANLRMTNAERIRFERVDLSESDFYAATLLAPRFFDCTLHGVQFSQAELPEARFHGSRLEGAKGAEYLRNVVIESSQVLTLALPVLTALGIRVEDDREPPGRDPRST